MCSEPERMTVTWSKFIKINVRGQRELSVPIKSLPSADDPVCHREPQEGHAFHYFHICFFTALGFPCFGTVFSPGQWLLQGLCNSTAQQELSRGSRHTNTAIMRLILLRRIQNITSYLHQHIYNISLQIFRQKVQPISTFTWEKNVYFSRINFLKIELFIIIFFFLPSLLFLMYLAFYYNPLGCFVVGLFFLLFFFFCRGGE